MQGVQLAPRVQLARSASGAPIVQEVQEGNNLCNKWQQVLNLHHVMVREKKCNFRRAIMHQFLGK